MVIKKMGAVSAALALVLVLGQSGCSYLFVNGPPENHAQLASFDCTDSRVLPVLDLVWAGLNGLGAASVSGDNTVANKDQVVLVGVAWLVLSGTSAIYGFSKTSTCGNAKRQRDDRLNGRQAQRWNPDQDEAAPSRPAARTAPGVTAPAAAPTPTTGQTSGASAAVPATVRKAAWRTIMPGQLDVRPVRSLAMRPEAAAD